MQTHFFSPWRKSFNVPDEGHNTVARYANELYKCTPPNNNHSTHNTNRSVEHLHQFSVELPAGITLNMLFSEPVALKLLW